MATVAPSFKRAAYKRPKKAGAFPTAYYQLERKLAGLFKKTTDMHALEPYIQEAFRDFLFDCAFPLALKNFDMLLQEKSGGKYLRDDGTVSWYHEFNALMMVLSLARKGHGKHGFNIKDLDEYGGLEVLICTHLRHDSMEDHKTREELQAEFDKMIEDIKHEQPEYFSGKHVANVETILNNIDLMTQKVLCNKDGSFKLDEFGKKIKEDVRIYTYRMVASTKASPIVFMLKQADIIHNFSTMLGTNKFTAERRAKRCNERENMYGARYGFSDIATNQWKRFASAIQVLDSNMGELVYKNFRYLESVDEFYVNSEDAFRRDPIDFPVSSRFLKRAMMLDLPEAIHPVHEFLKRMIISIDPLKDPEKYKKLQSLTENVIKPALETEKYRFPYLFSKASGDSVPQSAPALLPQ